MFHSAIGLFHAITTTSIMICFLEDYMLNIILKFTPPYLFQLLLLISYHHRFLYFELPPISNKHYIPMTL